jgi:predicted ATPase
MRRYIFTGAPGAGKTTLLEALSARGYPVVPEAATDVIAGRQAKGVPEPWNDVQFVTNILRLQVSRQVRATSAPVVLFDRSPVCTLALARFLGHPIPAALSDEVERLVADRRYEQDVFLVRPLWFIEPTAARRISYDDSLAFEAVHVSTYEELGFTLVHVLPGPAPTRAAAVHEAITSLDRQAPKGSSTSRASRDSAVPGSPGSAVRPSARP